MDATYATRGTRCRCFEAVKVAAMGVALIFTGETGGASVLEIGGSSRLATFPALLIRRGLSAAGQRAHSPAMPACRLGSWFRRSGLQRKTISANERGEWMVTPSNARP